MKHRLIAISGVIIIVLVVVLAVVASGSASTTVTVAQASDASQIGNKKIQVTGTVVTDSYSISGDTLKFAIYDPDGDQSQHLNVEYDGGVAATFGNGVSAICTGRLNPDVTLLATDLVTQCPSKYESSTSAVTVSQLLGYGSSIVDMPIKITGPVVAGSLQPVGGNERFAIADLNDATQTLAIQYNGALPDTVTDGVTVVLTGSLSADGSFACTNVALEG
jgi:cytochrome c-type biogenesis protein CcmE